MTIWLSSDKNNNRLPRSPQLSPEDISFVLVTRMASCTMDYNKLYLLTHSITFLPRGDKVLSSDAILLGPT